MMKEKSEFEISVHELFYRQLLVLEESGYHWSDEQGAVVAWHFDHNAWLNDWKLVEWYDEKEDDEWPTRRR